MTIDHITQASRDMADRIAQLETIRDQLRETIKAKDKRRIALYNIRSEVESRAAELASALRPFAEAARDAGFDANDDLFDNKFSHVKDMALMRGHFRLALAALASYASPTPPAALANAETAPQLLARLGDDASKWAAEFRQTAISLGYSDMDEGWLIGWFANAIEHSSDIRSRHGPDWRAIAIRAGQVLRVLAELEGIDRGSEISLFDIRRARAAIAEIEQAKEAGK